MTEEEEYRLVQHGQPVAWASGPDEDTKREICHYAAVYSEDGPVGIEQKVHGHWVRVWPTGGEG